MQINPTMTSKRIKQGFSLVEVLIYLALVSIVGFGVMQVIDLVRVEGHKIQIRATGDLRTEKLDSIIQSQLGEALSVEVCNAYGSASETSCPKSANTSSDDNACLLTQSLRPFERWGTDLEGGSFEWDFSNTNTNTEFTISMWANVRVCEDDDGSGSPHWGCSIASIGRWDSNGLDSSTDDYKAISIVGESFSGGNFDGTDSGDQLRLKVIGHAPGNSNIGYVFEPFSYDYLTNDSDGEWIHIALAVHEAESDNTIKWGLETRPGETEQEPSSFTLYVNGVKADYIGGTLTSISTTMSDWFPQKGSFLGTTQSTSSTYYTNTSGRLGAIQLFNEALPAASIRRLFNEVYLPEFADYELSMHKDDISFGSGSDQFSVNTGSTLLDCDDDNSQRFCAPPFDASTDSLIDYFEHPVIESEISTALLFARRPSSGTDSISGDIDWDERPWALYQKTNIGNECLENESPEDQTNPVDDGWTRLTAFEYFPGQKETGEAVFFSRPSEDNEIPSAYQLRVSSDYEDVKSFQRLSSVDVSRRLKNDAFCQISSDSWNFNVPNSGCELRYAQVVIQDGFNPDLDQLFIVPAGGWDSNWSYSASDTTPPAAADSECTAATNDVVYCQNADVAANGVRYMTITYKNLPLMGSSGSATYNTQTGILTLDAGSGNTFEADRWQAIFRFVRYGIQKSVDEGTDSIEYERDRTILFSLGEQIPFYPPDDPLTPHYYDHRADFPSDTEKKWTTAYQEARKASNKFCGLHGYLATITSAEENTFLATRFLTDDGGTLSGWLGGTDHDSYHETDISNIALTTSDWKGNWRWVGGPENGQIFARTSETGWGNTTRRALRYVVEGTTSDVCGPAGDSQTDILGATTNLSRFIEGVDAFPGASEWCQPTPGTECNVPVRFQNFPLNKTDGLASSCAVGTGDTVHVRQPDRAKNKATGMRESFLQMTGHALGGQMWNDLALRGTATTKEPYFVKGFYVEWGGCSEIHEHGCDGVDPVIKLTDKAEINVLTKRSLCRLPD